MKHSLILLLSTLVSLFFTACEKPLDETNELVTQVGIEAQLQSDGSILLKGKIIADGISPVENFGFDIADSAAGEYFEWFRQDLFESDRVGNEFTLLMPYSRLEFNRKPLFKAWVRDAFGHSFSKVIMFDTVAIAPIVFPCSYTPNTLDMHNGLAPEALNYEQFNESISGNVSFRFQSSNYSLEIYFGSTPRTGSYNVGRNGDVSIYVKERGFDLAEAVDKGQLHVNQTGPQSWVFQACDVEWKLDGSSSTFQKIMEFNVQYPLPE
jgi:hypothetical protein